MQIIAQLIESIHRIFFFLIFTISYWFKYISLIQYIYIHACTYVRRVHLLWMSKFQLERPFHYFCTSTLSTLLPPFSDVSILSLKIAHMLNMMRWKGESLQTDAWQKIISHLIILYTFKIECFEHLTKQPFLQHLIFKIDWIGFYTK